MNTALRFLTSLYARNREGQSPRIAFSQELLDREMAIALPTFRQ
jgi:hypothetical protein